MVVQTPSVILTPSSTYHYQTLSWLPPSFSIATNSLIPSSADAVAVPTATGTGGSSTQDVPAVIAPNAGAIIPGTDRRIDGHDMTVQAITTYAKLLTSHFPFLFFAFFLCALQMETLPLRSSSTPSHTFKWWLIHC
jgi:hypothetical protein